MNNLVETLSWELEIIGFTIEGCCMAEAAGATRIELCDNAGDGGTTPSYGFIKAAANTLKIPFFPIIRPRGGDFLFSDKELNMMLEDILICKQLGCQGVVTGALLQDGSIHTQWLQKVAALAYPMSLTFHRAFDRCKDPFTALEQIIDAGCERILTSGQHPTAPEGAVLLKELVEKAAERIIIMPGSGVNSSNIIPLATATGAMAFHASARKSYPSSMQFQPSSLQEKAMQLAVDTEEISSMAAQLQRFFSDHR